MIKVEYNDQPYVFVVKHSKWVDYKNSIVQDEELQKILHTLAKDKGYNEESFKRPESELKPYLDLIKEQGTGDKEVKDKDEKEDSPKSKSRSKTSISLSSLLIK